MSFNSDSYMMYIPADARRHDNMGIRGGIAKMHDTISCFDDPKVVAKRRGSTFSREAPARR
jgi:hypothetical protein